MKNKPILIIVASLIIFVLILVWVYLLFFKSPTEPEGTYSNLGENGEEMGNLDNNELPEIDPSKKLRQLTVKAVAGYQEMNNNDPVVRYIEMGTGHLYSVNPKTGQEVRLSGTTIPGTVEADLSPLGDFVAIGIKSNTKNTKLTLGKTDPNNAADITIEDLDITVDQFSIGDGEELLYTKREDLGLVGYSYKLDSGLTKKIFDLPFHEATVEWGKNSTDKHFSYPKTSYFLEGYLYEIDGSEVSRLPVEGFGLTAFNNDDHTVYTKTTNRTVESSIYNKKTGERKVLPIISLPEKCDFKDETTAICAHEKIKINDGYPDSWYQGEVRFKDTIWQIEEDGLTTPLIDTFEDSGREVDITNLTTTNDGSGVYFINKNDNTLWVYEF